MKDIENDWGFFIKIDPQYLPKPIIKKYKPSIIFVKEDEKMLYYLTKYRFKTPNQSVVFLKNTEILISGKNSSINKNISKNIRETTKHFNTLFIAASTIFSCGLLFLLYAQRYK